MEGVMKYLVGAACIAVIAASGFIIGKPLYDAHAEQVQTDAARQNAREALFEYSRAKPNEAEKVASICKFANKDPDMFPSGMAEKVVNTCLAAGFPIRY